MDISKAMKNAMLGDTAQRERVQGQDVMESIREGAFNLAFQEGNKYGVVGFIGGGIGALLANKYSPWFQKYMGLSAKASLPVMAGLFMWSLNFELTITDATRHPEKWGLIEGVEYKAEPKKVSKLQLNEQAMNYAYDHPFTMIVGAGVPLASGILYKNLQMKHLTLSQKIMHSRVFAQAGILTIALSTMAFRDYMGRRGRFLEPVEPA